MEDIPVEEKQKITVQVLLENFVDVDECIKDIMAEKSPYRYIASNRNKSQMPKAFKSSKDSDIIDTDISDHAIHIVAAKQKKDLALAHNKQFELLRQSTDALQDKTITLSEADVDCSTLVYFSIQAATDCLGRSKTKEQLDVVCHFLGAIKSTEYKFSNADMKKQDKLLKLIAEQELMMATKAELYEIFILIDERRKEYSNYKPNQPPTYSEQEILGHLVHLEKKLSQDEVHALTLAQFDLESGAITLTNDDTDLTCLMIKTALHVSSGDGKYPNIAHEFATSMMQGSHDLNISQVSILDQIKKLAS